MGKKIKIPKNKDIEEIVEQDEKTKKMDRRQKFKQDIELSEKQKAELERKVQNHFSRKNAQESDYQRRVKCLKAMSRIEEAQSEK